MHLIYAVICILLSSKRWYLVVRAHKRFVPIVIGVEHCKKEKICTRERSLRTNGKITKTLIVWKDITLLFLLHSNSLFYVIVVITRNQLSLLS